MSRNNCNLLGIDRCKPELAELCLQYLIEFFYDAKFNQEENKLTHNFPIVSGRPPFHVVRKLDHSDLTC